MIVADMANRPPLPFISSFFQKFSHWGIVAFWLYFFVLVIAYGTAINSADADLWHHFALVDHLLKTGHFPVGDTFSYDADYQLVLDHEWGSAFIFYTVYLLGGEMGLVLLKLFALGLVLALTVRAGLGNREPTLLVTFFFSLVLLALLPSSLSTIRSGVFTHIFLALWVFWFQRERQGSPIHYAGYFFTTVVWANMHAGFVVGLMWLTLITIWEFLTVRQWKQRGGLLLLCLLATLINPYGWHLWFGVIRAILISRGAYEEWAPVPWIYPYNTFSGYKLLLLWTLVILLDHVRRLGWKKCDQFAVILSLLFMAMSLHVARHTSLFAIVVGGLVPPLFAPEKSLHEIREWKPWIHRLSVRGILVILPLVLAARLFPSSEGFSLTYPPDAYPFAAINYLREHRVTGRLLVTLNSGSFALWELRGQMRVSMDGRYDLVYAPETFDKVQCFFAESDHWRDALINPKPDAALVNLSDPVYSKMLVEPGWTEVYQDATHAVFEPTVR
jgi:hypothetical protein